MKLKNSKKAQFDVVRKMLYFGIAGFIISMLAIGLVILTSNYKEDMARIPPTLESTLLSARFYSSPLCFAYQDPVTERAYPRLIDSSRFTSEILNSCYFSDTTKDFQFQILLKDLDSNKETKIQTAEWYNVPAFTITVPVSIKNEDSISKGQLLIFVQRPI